MAEVDDAYHLYTDEGCNYYQLVNWIDSSDDLKRYHLDNEVILRRNAAYDELDPMNQAANDLHEAIFKIKRAYELKGEGEGSSDVRWLVGQVFSEEPLDLQLVGILGGWCGDFAHPSPRNFFDPNEDITKNVIDLTLEEVMTPADFESSVLKITNLDQDRITINPYYSGAFEEARIAPGKSIEIRPDTTFGQMFHFRLSNSTLYQKLDRKIRLELTIKGKTYRNERSVSTYGFYWGGLAVLVSLSNPLY